MGENAITTQKTAIPAKTRIVGVPFKQGNPGRPAGIQNKLSKTVKETVLAVFNELQYHPRANLVTWAISEPTEFYRIAAKLIPTEITGSIKQTIVVTDLHPDNE